MKRRSQQKQEPRIRVIRTLVMEGTQEWIDAVLEDSVVDPLRPFRCPNGTITEEPRA